MAALPFNVFLYRFAVAGNGTVRLEINTTVSDTTSVGKNNKERQELKKKQLKRKQREGEEWRALDFFQPTDLTSQEHIREFYLLCRDRKEERRM